MSDNFSKPEKADIRAPDKRESRGLLWIIFFMPGVVLLWLQYMFPKNFGAAIGSARRRKSRLIQFWYTITFYLLVAILVLAVIHSMK